MSQDPVTELAGLLWVHWSTLIQPHVLHLALFTVILIHRFGMCTFLTSCNPFVWTECILESP